MRIDRAFGRLVAFGGGAVSRASKVKTFEVLDRFDRNSFVSISLSGRPDWVVNTHSSFENREFQALSLEHGRITV